nr:GIY-YIG nuclease family protein [Bacillus cereus]
MYEYGLFVLITIYCYSIYYFNVYISSSSAKKIREQIFGLANNTLELTTKEFLEMRNKSFGGKGRALYSNNYNFAGVYILHNKSKDLYYVGQGKQVLNRVNNHFTGKGNGDVYADYKYGDYWTIKMIALEKSGFNTLNELERYAIETYDAYKRGYNKTRGNK